MTGLMRFLKEQSKTFRTALFVVAFMSGMAFGQSEVGHITGKVVDPNGAVVPGAAIRAKSLETGLEREATVSTEGFYIIRSIPPGIYEIETVCKGFTARTQKVRVFIGSIIRFDPELTVQPITGEALVQENAAGIDVNYQTGQLSDPITNRMLNELPTLTRDPFSLITLSGNVTPVNLVRGITNGGINVFNNTQPFQDFAIDGQAPTTNNVHLDGGENIVNYWSTLGQRLPLVGTREINVITNGFRPEYGRLLGGLIDVASKQGTNDIRGQVLWFYRPDTFASNSFDNNARVFFNPVTGLPIGVPRGHLVGNQPGYAVGGAIIHDKLFFFSSAEGIIQRSRVNRVALVPTSGAGSLLAGSAPATQAFFATFPLKTNLNVGPTFNVNQTLAFLGLPSSTPGSFAGLGLATPAFQTVFTDVNNNFGAGDPQDSIFTINRVDYTLSDHSWLYGRYAYNFRDIFSGAFSFSPVFGFDSGVTDQSHNAAINWLYAFGGGGCATCPASSNWMLNVKAQFERVNIHRRFRNDVITTGTPVTPVTGITDGSITLAPRLLATGFANAGLGGVGFAFPGDLPFNPALNSLITGPLNLGQVPVDVFGTWRNHQLRFGGSYFYFQDNRRIESFREGQFTLGAGVPTALNSLVSGTAGEFTVAFNPTGVVTPATATSPALVTSPVLVPPDFSRSIREHDFALYASDIWRVGPRLSVLLGLRYDFFGTPRSRNNLVFNNFFLGPGPDFGTQVANGVLAAPNTSVTLANGTTFVTNRRFFDRNNTNFGPRIGVAWDLRSGTPGGCCAGSSRRLTLRAGYGISYDRLFYSVAPFFQDNANFAVANLTASTVPGFTGDVAPITLTTNNFGPFATASAAAPVPFLPLVRAIDTDLDTPHVHFWNVTLEGELSRNTVASVTYVGSAGRDLLTVSNINRPGSAFAFGTVTDPTSLARLNPNFGPIFFLRSNGRSNYNAFIGEVASSAWRSIGLLFTARYRFAKALDNVSSILANNIGTFGGSFTPNLLSPFDPNFDYGRSDFDVTHRFVGSFNWEVPYAWFDNGCCGGNNNWRRLLLGGWGLAGIFQAQSGLPFTVFDCNAAITPETPCLRAGLAPGVRLQDINDGNGSSIPDATTPNFFNFLGAGAFTLSGPTTAFPTATTTTTPFFPTFGLNTPGRNAFRGEGFVSFDFGVYKRFQLTETVGLQLRGEFFNLFNHPNRFVPFGVDISSNPFVPSFKDGARFIQVGAKFLF